MLGYVGSVGPWYSLDEMLNKCRKLQELSILGIDTVNRNFTVNKNLEEILVLVLIMELF